MTLNTLITANLQVLDKVLSKRGNSPFITTHQEIVLKNSGRELARISDSEILISGENWEDKIMTTVTDGNPVKSNNNFKNFINEVSHFLTRLNHLGISYYCDNIEEEMRNIQVNTKKSGLKTYLEVSDDPDQKWIFIGDTNNWQDPLFEIVLSKVRDGRVDFWRPHFQIDIDTSLAIKDIKRISDRYFGLGFIKWQLETANIGTVLGMGILGNVGGTKLALGVGTNLRDTMAHRRNDLRKLI